MHRREYDIILYGASGFTSSFVIRELEMSPLRIAVSSRDISKISETMLPKLECSIENIKTLTSKTRVLISCVGPYALHGEKIVGACVVTGTHYLDICGEPSFLETIYKRYNERAEDKNLKIIQCCGFDSLPADIGTYILGKRRGVSNVEIVLSAPNCKIHKTTWDSLLLSLTSFQKRPRTKQIKDGYNISTSSSHDVSSASLNGTVLGPISISNKAREYKFVPELDSYVVRFRGADPYIIRRSSAFFRKKGISDIRASCYLKIGGVVYLVIYYVILLFIYFMSKYEWTSSLLRKYSGFFSFGVVTDKPSEKDIENSSFQVFFKAVHAVSKEEHYLKISGPNPGYISTAIFVTQSAFALIEEEDKIRCGVLTPAIALYKTRIVERLSSKGISFDYCH